MGPVPRIAVTTGEPAGIGPDLCLALTARSLPAELVLIGDRSVLVERALKLGVDFQVESWQQQGTPIAGRVTIANCPVTEPVQAGALNPANAGYVLETLDRAIQGCTDQQFQALVTAPIHKGVINDAGIAFTGHTEYLADKTGAGQVVMMLAAPGLRVALATTHLPLSAVAGAITRARIESVLNCLHRELTQHFGIRTPHILVAGLNPHAGEGGHMGNEEIEIIEPAIERLQQQGLHISGPLPADTLFTPLYLQQADAVLAMYHDQGLPVLKHMGFGQAVNITLGLPIIRTSVDHGTALDKAGTGRADTGSMIAAIDCAIDMIQHSAT